MSFHSPVLVGGWPGAPLPRQQGSGEAWACAVLSALTHTLTLQKGGSHRAGPGAHSLACAWCLLALVCWEQKWIVGVPRASACPGRWDKDMIDYCVSALKVHKNTLKII